jgi:hypothetical protein
LDRSRAGDEAAVKAIGLRHRRKTFAENSARSEEGSSAQSSAQPSSPVCGSRSSRSISVHHHQS